MMKRKVIMIAMILAMVFSNSGFAGEAPEEPGDLPLGENQERLFVVEKFVDPVENSVYDFEEIGMCVISHFGYDLEKKEVYPQWVFDEDSPQNNLSPDGTEKVYLESEYVEDGENGIHLGFIVFQKLESDDSRRIPISSDQFYKPHSLYTTEKYIVISYGTTEERICIERYTFDGVLKGSVMANRRISSIIEGPNGTSLYLQKVNLDMEINQVPCENPIELIQINWDGKSNVGSPKHVIQEKTRVGQTLARFTDSQFGLLRLEEPETGIVDYQAPIRSKENLVKLQIPYGDIQEKCASGARNLLVEYQGQTLSFPMDLFDCDDMLASMPCQSDSTIEIILHTDEAGIVTYEVQLFVVEQVNAMTRVVHRKTIQ